MRVLIGIYIFILGTIFGSFFGVIIDRLPKGESIVSPASRCDNCGHVLKWYENIPLFSYLFLGRKCSNCKTKIDGFLFIYELIGGLSLLLIYLKFGISFECLFIESITLVMLLIAGYDYKTNTILNIFLYILAILCVGLFVYRVFVLRYFFLSYVLSSLLGLVFFLSVKLIMNKILKKESLGSGDIYLVTILGIAFDPVEQLLAILFASLIGSIISIAMIKLDKRQRDAGIAFCPYLCLGYYIVFMFGEVLAKFLVG